MNKNEFKTFSIYGFFANGNDLQYIGLTSRNPQTRLSEHMYFVENRYKAHPQQNRLYKYIRIARERGWPIEFRVLYQVYTSRAQAEKIEADFITKMNPRWNIAGKTIPYNYVPKKRKKT